MRSTVNLNKNMTRQPSFYRNSVVQQHQLPTPQVYYSLKKLQHINTIISPNLHEGGIFLGNIICILKSEILIKNNIQAIVSCVDRQAQYISSIPSHIRALHIRVQDNMECQISQQFFNAYKFIQQARNERKNVLVHCHAGISRSATILCAYMMIKYKMSPQQALKQIKKSRQQIKPNSNFLCQLDSFYEKQIIKKEENSQLNTNFNKQQNHENPIFSDKDSFSLNEKLKKQEISNNKLSHSSIYHHRNVSNFEDLTNIAQKGKAKLILDRKHSMQRIFEKKPTKSIGITLTKKHSRQFSIIRQRDEDFQYTVPKQIERPKRMKIFTTKNKQNKIWNKQNVIQSNEQRVVKQSSVSIRNFAKQFLGSFYQQQSSYLKIE